MTNTTGKFNRDKASTSAAIATGLVAFSIPMLIRVSSWIALAVFVVYLVYAIIRKQDIISFFKHPFFIFIGFHFLVLLAGLIHSPDMKQGLADIERFGLAILLPFTVYLLGRSNARFGDAMLGFILGCVVVTLYGFGYTFFAAGQTERAIILSHGHSQFSMIFNLHPFYLSIYLIFILFYITEKVRTNVDWRSGTKLGIVVASVLAVLAMIFFLRSQIALLILAQLVVLYCLIAFKERAAMVTFIFFSIGLIVFLVDTNRTETIFDTYGQNVSTAVDNRLQVWKGALTAIKDSPVFGVGTGGTQIKLNEAYVAIGYNEGAEKNYNAHNQYLEVMVRNGIIELVAFLAVIVFCFRRAQGSERFLFLLFMMMFCLSMIAESFVNVQKGIMFFYFFAAVFIFLPVRSLNDSQ